MAFLNPVFLVGALAAALPVLVHLVRRTRARRIRFPSLMFLRNIEQKTIRKRHLRNLALLLMRCAALMLLALAFARPYLTGANPVSAGSGQASSIILIDTSYSMQYPGVFQRARQAARKVIDDSSSDERIAVVLFSGTAEVLRPLKADAAEARTLVDQAEPGLGPTDYVQALQTAEALLRDAGNGRRRVHLITDFQASGWNRSAPPFKFPSGTELIPIDVSDAKARNLAALEVSAEPLVYTQKYTGKVVARIGGYTSSPDSEGHRTEVVADLKLNDLPAERRPVTLEPGVTATIEFTGFNLLEGTNRALVEVTGDDFPLDNRVYFTMRRENQIKVLAIETAGRGRSESFFIQQSLLAGDSNPYTLTVKTAGSASPQEIDGYGAVVVNDSNDVNEGLAGALKSFVERGGGLIIAAGRHTDAGDFNRKFKEITPAEIGETVLSRGSYALMSQVKTDHPLFSNFARGGRLTSTKVYGYHRSTPRDGAEVLAALDDGSPMIVERVAGRGKVILVTSTLDTAWNDLPLTPVFLPLLNQTLDYLGNRGAAPSHLVGQAFSVAADQDGSHPAVDSPSGKRIDAARTASGADSVNASEAGFYRLRYRDHSDFVAVNLDTRDADLSKLGIEEFLAAFTGGSGSPRDALPAERSTPEEIEKRQRFWLPLLVVSLLLFLGEALLARRIKVPKLIG
ncbi:MAG TPA: VWA domain-containing protein [Blastocatellia bacterium]|nr:VWA domain-containing protein [Blastocatellia bacterium]